MLCLSMKPGSESEVIPFWFVMWESGGSKILPRETGWAWGEVGIKEMVDRADRDAGMVLRLSATDSRNVENKGTKPNQTMLSYRLRTHACLEEN